MRILGLVAIAVFTLAYWGCGSSSEPTPSPTPEPTATPIATLVPSPTARPTSTPTPLPTPTATATPVPTPTPATPIPTKPPAPTYTATVPPTYIPTPIPEQFFEVEAGWGYRAAPRGRGFTTGSAYHTYQGDFIVSLVWEYIDPNGSPISDYKRDEIAEHACPGLSGFYGYKGNFIYCLAPMV